MFFWRKNVPNLRLWTISILYKRFTIGNIAIVLKDIVLTWQSVFFSTIWQQILCQYSKIQIMKNNNNHRKVNWWYIGFVTMSNVVTWSKNRNSRWKFYGTLKFKGTNLLVSIHIWKSTSVSINSFIMNKSFNCILFFIVAVSAGSNYEDYYRSQV